MILKLLWLYYATGRNGDSEEVARLERTMTLDPSLAYICGQVSFVSR